MVWTLLYVVALASASVANAGKPGCNIKAVGSKRKKGPERRLANENGNVSPNVGGGGGGVSTGNGGGDTVNEIGIEKREGAWAMVDAIRSQLDLGDFDYQQCKKQFGPGQKMEMEVQLNPLEKCSLFAVEQHQNHPRALTGKRMKNEAGASKIGELNIIFGERGDMSGSAQMDGNIYLFTTLEDGSAWTDEIKLSDLPPDDLEVNVNEDAFIKEDLDVISGEGTRMLRQRELQEEVDERLLIDVLVPFTRQTMCAIAQAASPDRCVVNERRLEMVQTRIELAIFEANVAFENSGIPGRLRLAHSYLIDQDVDWDENALRYGDILYQLAVNGDDIMDEVHEQRVKYGADVVSLWVNNMSSCGLAYMGTPVASRWAFSVVNWLCATGYYSFAHEIAHHLGAKHDRGSHQCPDPECCGKDCYNFGWQDPLARFRSIMSYNCPTEEGCPRVQYFSQPQNFYPLVGGEGDDVREVRIGSGSMNNARILRETFKTVSAYHESVFDPTPPTAAPVAPTHCGNGICEPQKYEDCQSCPQDCIGGIYQGAECNNGICEPGENCNNCPEDCPLRLDVFRDDLKYCCEGGPKERTGQIPFGVSCGDHSYCTFNTQCDTHPPKTGTYCCGNGICELGENVGSCSTDCQCQDDGVCDLFEDGSCTDCQDVALTTTKCMGVGRVCTAIFEDPCCGSCDATTRKCV